MTLVTPTNSETRITAVKDESKVSKERRTPVFFGAFSIMSLLLFVFLRREGTSTLSFDAAGSVTIPEVSVHASTAGIVVTFIAVALTIIAIILTKSGHGVPRWLTAIFALNVLFGFLVWSVVDQTLPVTSLFGGALALSVPVIFGAIGGVLSERVGVVNVAIEGQLLAGAFSSALVSSLFVPLWGTAGAQAAGMIGAVASGAIVSALLAVFAIKYLVDQVIVGVVLNVFVLGITSFFYNSLLAAGGSTFNQPSALPHLPIPLLSQIPIVGPVLFDQTVIVYVMYAAVVTVYFGLMRTPWGLRVRAVGEHPMAADTVGINVIRTRVLTVVFAGAVAGLGGAYFTLGSGVGFVQNMTNGAGYIALAAVIFGRWDPLLATLAAVLFGFANNLQSSLSLLRAPIPSEFLSMLPYLVTIVAVAGLVGRVRPPAAAGKPYVKS